MQYTMTQSTVFPIVEATLQRGEVIRIERGAMVYHRGEVQLEGKMNSNEGGFGGVMKAIGRSMVSGESMFITHVTALADGAVIGIAPGTPGAIWEIPVGQQQWRIADSAFLACDGNVGYTMQRQNLGNALFGGTGGLFVMETQGTGRMLISSYGDIMQLNLDGTKPLIVDNTHVVAWHSTLNYQIRVASGTFGFKSGEGLVNEFYGYGTVLVQTRNVSSLAALLSPHLNK